MAHKFLAAATLQELEFILNGGVMGGNNLNSPEGYVLGLDTKTLIIGVTTVTFSDPTGVGIKLYDSTGGDSIVKEIEDTVAGVSASFRSGRLALEHASGVTVDKDGTANAIFGFSKGSDTVGVVYNFPGGAAPRVVSIGSSPRMDNYFAHLEV